MMKDFHKQFIAALCDVSHDIDDEKVVIRFNSKRPGRNALDQFLSALAAHMTAPELTR